MPVKNILLGVDKMGKGPEYKNPMREFISLRAPGIGKTPSSRSSSAPLRQTTCSLSVPNKNFWSSVIVPKSTKVVVSRTFGSPFLSTLTTTENLLLMRVDAFVDARSFCKLELWKYFIPKHKTPFVENFWIFVKRVRRNAGLQHGENCSVFSGELKKQKKLILSQLRVCVLTQLGITDYLIFQLNRFLNRNFQFKAFKDHFQLFWLQTMST